MNHSLACVWKHPSRKRRRRGVTGILSLFPKAPGWIRTFLTYYDSRHSLKRDSGLCVFRFAWLVSRWHNGARVMHLELFFLCIPCMFVDPQIPAVIMKNAAGRMPDLGQSLVYSPGRMKATHITNSFALLGSSCWLFFPVTQLWSYWATALKEYDMWGNMLCAKCEATC